MTHSRTCLALTAIFTIAVGAGCSKERPAASPDQGAMEIPPPAASAAAIAAPQEVRSAVEVPAPRLVKTDTNMPTVGTSNPQAAQLAEMRKPYTNLSKGEAAYFDVKFLNKDVLGEVMRSPDFNSKVLDLQSGGDVNAMARQRAYTDAFRRSLQPYADRARLEGIGCGTVLCMGSLRTNTKDWIGAWTVELHKQPLPLPSLSIQPIPRGSEYEVRFSFTTAGGGGFTSSGP